MNENFDYIYPKGERITPEKLGLNYEEMLSGIYLNIDHTALLNDKIDSSKIISIGMGRNSKIVNNITLDY